MASATVNMTAARNAATVGHGTLAHGLAMRKVCKFRSVFGDHTITVTPFIETYNGMRHVVYYTIRDSVRGIRTLSSAGAVVASILESECVWTFTGAALHTGVIIVRDDEPSDAELAAIEAEMAAIAAATAD